MAIKKPLPLSVCMISGAEASRIGRALESVSWAAEIVVVLNEGVNDGTEQIAHSHGARVFRESWRGFIAQKNSASEKATQPWLLNLDADEIVSEELAREIAQVVSNPEPAHVAYDFPRCTNYCGRWIRHGDWYPDRVLRLWRKDAARWAGQDPHAKLDVRGSIGKLRSDLLHYTNESIAHHVSKIVPYTEDFVKQQSAKSGAGAASMQLLARPAWKFLRSYVLRLGFLDGWQGCYIAWAGAFSVATKYARAREVLVNRSGK